MSSEHAQSDSFAEPRPYPRWWDVANGILVSLIALAATFAVLSWMVGMMVSTYR